LSDKFISITQEEKDELENKAEARGKAAGIAEAEAKTKDQVDAARKEGVTEGATAERERIKAVHGRATPGHDALISELMFDGKTTGAEAGDRVLAAEKAKTGGRLTEMRGKAQQPVDTPANPDKESADVKLDPKVVAAKARAYQAEQKKLGIEVTTEEAVAHIRKEMGAPAKPAHE
jgi:hypothetical protein